MNVQIRTLKVIALFGAFLFLSLTISAQEIVEEYSGPVPNSKNSGKKETFNSGMFRGVTKPTLEIYLPEKEKTTGTAVIIIPGGSYAVVVYQGEGISTAKQFAKNKEKNEQNERVVQKGRGASFQRSA